MRVCKDCFSDEELCREIDSNAETEGKCDICGGRGKVIDVNDLYDFLSNVVNLFCKNPEATETITDILQNDWNLFNNVRCADIIVTEILDRMNPVLDKMPYLTFLLTSKPTIQAGCINLLKVCMTYLSKYFS